MNIVEGVYSMHPMLVNSYDFSVFIKIDEECQKERILVRNGIEMQKRFIKEWIPLENRYFKELKIEEKCDMILNGGKDFESNCYRRTRGKDGAIHCGTNKEY
jgi:dephospho-CoA kinase